MRALVLILALAVSGVAGAADTIPRDCIKYRLAFIRNAKSAWGVDAPVATLAAQMRQESGCRADAKSRFADGLAQFTPETAAWISSVYPDLAENQPTNPVWAMRAQAHYMLRQVRRANGETECDSMWIAHWDYNGGEGWRRRDQKLAAANGANPRRHVEVEPFNAGRAPAFFNENRGYPKAIIQRWQPLFIAAGWGAGVCL